MNVISCNWNCLGIFAFNLASSSFSWTLFCHIRKIQLATDDFDDDDCIGLILLACRVPRESNMKEHDMKSVAELRANQQSMMRTAMILRFFQTMNIDISMIYWIHGSISFLRQKRNPE